jgi:hypothetical protein
MRGGCLSTMSEQDSTIPNSKAIPVWKRGTRFEFETAEILGVYFDSTNEIDSNSAVT